MSLAEDIVELSQRRELKTLVIDIERLRGTAKVPFWSLNDYKNRRISHEYVTEWPRTICGAWRWYGKEKIHFAAEWVDGPRDMAIQLCESLNQADIVTGHNIDRFDIKHLRSLFRDHGLVQPPKFKTVDTLKVARAALGDESLTLDALCQRYGIPTKVGRYDHDVALAATQGDKKAQRQIRLYNMADVEASTGLYTVLLPLVSGHPHVAPIAAIDKNLCPRCGSADVERKGSHSPAVLIYRRYLCRTCEGWFRTTTEGRGPGMRAL